MVKGIRDWIKGILQNSSYYPKVQGEVQNFQNVQDYLTGQAANLDTAATNAQATTDATKQQTQAAFANEPATFQNQINAETTAAQAPATTQATQLAADFKSGDPTKVVADLKQAGVDTNTIQQYLTALTQQNGKPIDLSQFYSFNPNTAVTTANAANAQDYANAAAYNKLTGVDYSGILNPANAAQAGTAPTALAGVNAASLPDYLKTQYENAELAKLGAPTLTSSTATGNPNTSLTPSLPVQANQPTNAVGNTLGTIATSGIPVPGINTAISGAVQSGENFVNKAIGIGGGRKTPL